LTIFFNYSGIYCFNFFYIFLQERQCSASMELSLGAAEGQTHAPGAHTQPAQDLPGDALHSGMDGRDQGNKKEKMSDSSL
jgi:hypothetical protein